MEQVSKMDILLSFYQWRPVSLIPAMRDFNDPVVEEANRLSARDFKSNAIDPSFSGTVRMKAHGTPAEIGDYVEFNGGGLRFVSGRLRALLESMGQRDVQFFPADIETGPNLNSPSRYGGGPKLENFWWMHHWRRLDLIVRARPFLEAHVSFEVTPLGSGACVRMTETPRGAFVLLGPLIGPFVRWRNSRSLATLAERMASSSS